MRTPTAACLQACVNAPRQRECQKAATPAAPKTNRRNLGSNPSFSKRIASNDNDSRDRSD